MLYSEMPDMSSHDQDFLPKQQQKKSPQPGGGPSDRSSEHGPLATQQPTGNGRAPMATGLSPSNGRNNMTTHASGTGNWNGNNHHTNDPLPLPTPPLPLINPNVNGSDNTYQPHPPPSFPRPTHHSDSRENSSYSRGLRTSNISSQVYDRPHPYQRPSSQSLGLDPTLAIGPASFRPHSSVLADHRVLPPQLR